MARAATGQVVERRRDRGTVYALRFRACGDRRYVTLGSSAEGWNRDRAEQELANTLADVRRGLWRPPAPEPVPELPTDPTFHEFSSEWFAEQEPGWRENTRAEARWMLVDHLLPFFHAHKLSQITVAEVDRYRTGKVREGRLSATSINRSIMRLGQVLDSAWERDSIASNPVARTPRTGS